MIFEDILALRGVEEVPANLSGTYAGPSLEELMMGPLRQSYRRILYDIIEVQSMQSAGRLFFYDSEGEPNV